jgi:aminoglycoside phosphotransferase (APT) family kinase protein
MTSTSVGRHPTALGLTGLPILTVALDAADMAVRLAPLLAPWGSPNGPPRVTYARLLAYKRGNRGAIEYLLEGAAGHARVLGKLYPHPARAARVESVLRELQAALATTDDLAAPRPLGCVPELSMLVYEPVEGRLLDEILLGPDGERGGALVARWLAALHGSRVTLDRSLVPADELVTVEAWVALVEHASPVHAAAVRRLQDFVRVAVDAPFRRDTPVHRDFHYHHVLVGERLGVIDLDELRLGDPALDIAHFCVHLRLLGCRMPGAADRLRRIERVFLDQYAALSGWQRDERYDWFAVYTRLKIAKQLCITRGVRPRPDGDEQARQVQFILAGGQVGDDWSG